MPRRIMGCVLDSWAAGGRFPPLFLSGDMGCEDKMARLVLNREGVDLVVANTVNLFRRGARWLYRLG